jgi:hypothetical protein
MKNGSPPHHEQAIPDISGAHREKTLRWGENVTQIVKDTFGAEMNKYWKSQQPNPGVVVPTEKQPQAPPKTVPKKPTALRIPINLIDVGRPKVVPPNAVGDIQKRIREGTEKPILVRKNGDRYTLIDGSIRVQCYRLLGLETIPAKLEKGS